MDEKIKILIGYRVARALETVEDARANLQQGRFRTAFNRIYYSIFYIVSALALKDGFSTSKHSQLMGWFIKEYIKSGKVESYYSKIYKNSYDKRQKGDYDDMVVFEREQVEKHFADMLVFVKEIEKLIDL